MLACVANAHPSAHNQLSANKLEGLRYGQSCSGSSLFKKAAIFGTDEPYKNLTAYVQHESHYCNSQMPMDSACAGGQWEDRNKGNHGDLGNLSVCV